VLQLPCFEDAFFFPVKYDQKLETNLVVSPLQYSLPVHDASTS
jgi:hypothetical protein